MSRRSDAACGLIPALLKRLLVTVWLKVDKEGFVCFLSLQRGLGRWHDCGGRREIVKKATKMKGRRDEQLYMWRQED